MVNLVGSHFKHILQNSNNQDDQFQTRVVMYMFFKIHRPKIKGNYIL